MPVASSPENAVNAPMLKVCIQTVPFDPGQALHALRCNQSGEPDLSIGAVASFIGLVREFNEGDDVKTLEL